MKQFSLVALFTVTHLFAFNPILENDDNRRYTITVFNDQTTRTESIRDHSSTEIRGTGARQLTVHETGDTITVEQNRTYTILNGKIFCRK